MKHLIFAFLILKATLSVSGLINSYLTTYGL